MNRLFKQFNMMNNIRLNFVAGTIFWTRSSLMVSIFAKHMNWIMNNLNDSTTYDINWMQYNKEKVIGNILWKEAQNKNYIRDGMIEHALERFFGYATNYYGYRLVGV